MYVLSTGCQWRAIPKDLPARSTVNDYFALWAWDGTLDRIHHALYINAVNRRTARPARPPPSRQPKRKERRKRGAASTHMASMAAS